MLILQVPMDMHTLVQSLKDLKEKADSLQEILKFDKKQNIIATLSVAVSQPDFWQDQEKATGISKQLNDLQGEIDTWTALSKQIGELLEMAELDEADTDVDLRADIEAQYALAAKGIEQLELRALLGGKHDEANAIVSIHAGAGGTEAQDWAEMLLRMIMRYAEKKGWQTTLLDESRGQEAGIKSATLRIAGRLAFGYLQSEHGTHRLVRISPFDAEKMRHTSFASIEVIPEIEHAELEIDDNDLRIDTFMSGGNGGQSVNTTYSAVRIVHMPTGTTVQCQNEKSQLQNKQTAMKILYSRLQKKKEEEEEAERAALRGAYKKAEWGSQIRSYVLHPYKMVKDVRTKYESSDPDAVLDGDLDPFVEAYLLWQSTQS